MPADTRIVISGVAANTPLGDTLDAYLEALLSGRSAISRWKALDCSHIYAKVGGDLSSYDVARKVSQLESLMPADNHARLRKIVKFAPWSTGLSVLVAVDAYGAAGLFDAAVPRDRIATIVAGHNINNNYVFDMTRRFDDEPEFIDGMYSLLMLDTDHAGSVSEVLDARGPLATVGAACASGNVALASAMDQIRYHDVDVAMVVGAVLDYAPLDLQAMALMGAISWQSFNDRPEAASRPFDTKREGFVPSHGAAALVVESYDHALRRGAEPLVEVVGVETNSDANHLPQPSTDGQAALMQRLLGRCGVAPEEVDYVSAHATSTPNGDVSEIRALKRAFGGHAARLKINAPKSLLGHTCWSSAVVETVAAILQIRAGRLHPSINIDELDPEVDLDVCAGGAVDWPVQIAMKSSFGFGGVNSISLLRRMDGWR